MITGKLCLPQLECNAGEVSSDGKHPFPVGASQQCPEGWSSWDASLGPTPQHLHVIQDLHPCFQSQARRLHFPLPGGGAKMEQIKDKLQRNPGRKERKGTKPAKMLLFSRAKRGIPLLQGWSRSSTGAATLGNSNFEFHGTKRCPIPKAPSAINSH